MYSQLRTELYQEFYGQYPVTDEAMWVKSFGTELQPLPGSDCTSGVCKADLDDGSGDNVPDGGVDINDLLYYLVLFDGGALCADVDDGSGNGDQDGGVDINDLLYYLQRFDAGC